MEIKSYKNAYGHQVVNCPFCQHFSYVRDSYKASPDPLRDLKRHITNAAKDEALAVSLDSSHPIPHLTYFKEHTMDAMPVIKKVKRQYDNDLLLKN